MTEKKKEESIAIKKHICSVCARPSDTVICHACEDRLRAEALEKKRDEEHGH
jgi:recombinational DNA repair protein RecR